MKSASVVYWSDERRLRLDGGGQRALSWKIALEGAGFETEIIGLWTSDAERGASGALSKVKRKLIPMPFQRAMPSVSADLVVATVPAVFRDASRHVPRSRLILDWMDLWSHNSRNMGRSNLLSTPGGLVQSAIWSVRERALPSTAFANAYAGYEDWERSSTGRHRHSVWIPNVISRPLAPARDPRSIRKVGFIGSMNYPPNEMSLKWFFRTYGEALRLKGIEVVVAGFASERVRDWGVAATVIGPVETVDNFYSSIDAAVVPIVHGGGIKAKAIEAFSYRVPVFGTEHVRAGFAPELRPWVLDLARLVSSSEPPDDVMPAELFEKFFTQSAFNRAASALLADFS